MSSNFLKRRIRFKGKKVNFSIPYDDYIKCTTINTDNLITVDDLIIMQYYDAISKISYNDIANNLHRDLVYAIAVYGMQEIAISLEKNAKKIKEYLDILMGEGFSSKEANYFRCIIYTFLTADVSNINTTLFSEPAD